MTVGACATINVAHYIRWCRGKCMVHIGVGLYVVRSTGMGNARASECGTATGKFSTLFLYVRDG